jgi:hypothetical protein
MCKTCKQFKLGELSSKEALKLLGDELSSQDCRNKDHLWRAIDMIMDKELPQTQPDEEIESEWWKKTHAH